MTARGAFAGVVQCAAQASAKRRLFLEHVASQVGLLHLAADDVRQAGLDNFLSKMTPARSPRS
jgi:hypothetical protein